MDNRLPLLPEDQRIIDPVEGFKLPELPEVRKGWVLIPWISHLQRRATTDCWEVLMPPDNRIWKFYPPKNNPELTSLVDTLKSLPPFTEDPDLSENLDQFLTYVNLWIIQDDFEDHRIRRKYRDDHLDIALYIDSISKFKWNLVNNILGPAFTWIFSTIPGLARLQPLNHLSFIKDTARNEDIWFPDRQDATDGLVRWFDTLTFENKVKFLERIDLEIVKFLQSVLAAITSK